MTEGFQSAAMRDFEREATREDHDRGAITCLSWKDEGEDETGRRVGPLTVEVDGVWCNWRHSEVHGPSVKGPGFFAAWFRVIDAREIAKGLGVKLVEG
jgi:hypothetical protein